MVYYYKLAASLLEKYITQIEKLDYKGVSSNIGQIILQERNWVRDDVDVPEAVEAAEFMAFGPSQEWNVDESRLGGHRWVTDECLRRIMESCQRHDRDVVGVIVTIINQSPFPE